MNHEDMGACIEFAGYRDRRGYGRRNFRGRPWLAHRIEWTLQVGEIPAGLCVCHRCDNPPCINIAHLFLGTHADNMRDMQAKKRYYVPNERGTQRYNAKLNDAIVRRLRAAYARGENIKAIADELGVTPAAAGYAARGAAWRHVK